MWVPEILIHCGGNGRCIAAHTRQHTCLGCINDVGYQGSEAVLKVSDRVQHHPTDACCLLERFKNNIKAGVNETCFKDGAHPLNGVNELRNWQESEEEKSMR